MTTRPILWLFWAWLIAAFAAYLVQFRPYGEAVLRMLR